MVALTWTAANGLIHVRQAADDPADGRILMTSSYNMSFACLDCCKSFKRSYDVQLRPDELTCPSCGWTSYNFGRHFKPPKSSDKEQWEKIRFLFQHGFRFQIIRVGDGHHDTIAYPDTLAEAREFVVEYADYARRDW